MSVLSLPFRRMAFAVLFVPLLTMAGLSRAFAQSEIPEGALSGQFTISEGHQVYFSQGNLQYQASTNTWRFAENQWDVLGDANNNISSTYDGWIDLFGWGTSGYNHGANCYQPWSTSENNEDYWAYANPSANLFDPTGQADWGYNAISNGGDTENSGWRTLTIPEWEYLLYSRNVESGIRFAKARVNNIGGILIFPDNWDASLYNLNSVNYEYNSYNENEISLADWTSVFEPAGVVFLPENGMRSGTLWDSGRADYWSADRIDNWTAYGLYFHEWDLSPYFSHNRFDGKSVRLARFVQEYSFNINVTSNTEEGGTVSGGGSFAFGETCTVTATVNEGYLFRGWMRNGALVSTDYSYTFTVIGDCDLVADFTQIFPAITDDFNDGEINPAYWTTADYVSETDGLLQLYESTALLQSAPIAFPVNNKIVLNRRFYLHEYANNYYYFFGYTKFLFDGNGDDNYIHVKYYDDEYYYGKHGTYFEMLFDGYYNEMYLCDVTFDTWLNETVVLDLTENSLSYYLDNVLIGTMEIPAVTFNYLMIQFSPDGCMGAIISTWTGS